MSSYAKALEGVMRLFPKKVKVTLVDAESGSQIGQIKMTLDQLPEKFNKPTLINALGRKWRVLGANPRRAIEFEFTKNLSLTVSDTNIDMPVRGRYYIPSVANEMPKTSESSVLNQFILGIEEGNWRQIEFLPVSMLDQVKEDVSEINSILHPEKKYDRLIGYQRRHVREKIMLHNHNIPFDRFCELVNVMEKGGVRVVGYSDRLVKDSFALRSLNYEYYGLVQHGMIRSLCINEFDCVDEELVNVLSGFGMVMVIWCEGKIISGEVKEGGDGEVDLANSEGLADAAVI